jgi:chemotaxis protein methyltransferase CheR
MKPEDFGFLAALLKRQSGLVLTPDKSYLVESRLLPITRKHGLESLDALVGQLRTSSESSAIVKEVIDAMTTNESFFFRDIKPFDQFKQLVLPRLMQARAATRKIRIWSAACSSGQEPYSLAMILREEGAKLAGWRFEIMATDISVEMLEKSKAGMYSQFEVQRGLPVQYLVKYFAQMGDKWKIDPSLREIIQFREFNLLNDPSPLGQFDVVFCRNVLIYFDNDTKRQILERVNKLMPGDGFLYLGGAETVLGITDRFQAVPGERGIYCRVMTPPAAAPAPKSAVS